MALFHLHVRNISRGDGRSAVACAAYRAGETLPNEAEESASAFGGRRDVVFAEIHTPAGAPDWMRDRASLWNGVERAEKRRDARLAKEIEFALPRDLPRAEWLGLARQMADAYTSRGHIVDLAIHDDGTAHNPHVHLLLTTRAIVGDGFGGKLREADGRQFVQEARSLWAKIANTALGAAGFTLIDPRSHAARGITEEPGQHHGPDRAARRERREEGLRMGLDEDLITARNELAAAAGIRERFPILSARPDWPPEQRQATGYLLPEARAEHDRFWREVHQRALEPERIRDDGVAPAGHDDAGRVAFADDMEGLVSAAEHAAAKDNILDRHLAIEDARAAFAGLRDRMVTEMVRAGLMEPRTAEHVRIIEQKLYPDEFSRMRAEAQRVYAKRHEAGQMPTPTPAMLRQAADMERAEFESRGVAYDPRTQTPKNSLQRVIAHNWGWRPEAATRDSVPEPVPDPDGRPITEPELHQAEERMLEEVEQPAREVPQPPRPEHALDVERQLAEASVDRQNAIDVPEVTAESYRLAPQEDRLDWLQAVPRVPVPEAVHEEARNDDRLDWLRPANKLAIEIQPDTNFISHDRYKR